MAEDFTVCFHKIDTDDIYMTMLVKQAKSLTTSARSPGKRERAHHARPVLVVSIIPQYEESFKEEEGESAL